MTRLPAFVGRWIPEHLHGVAQLVSSGVLLTLSGFLLLSQANAIRSTRDVALPLAATLPPLEQRLALLNQEVNLSQLKNALQSGSPEEKLHVFVLPNASDTTRLLALFDTLHSALAANGSLQSMSSIDVGDPQPVSGMPDARLATRTISVRMKVHDDGLKQTLSLIRVTGLLTVADAFTPEQINQMVHIIESNNPGDLIALEQFLHTDVLVYGRQASQVENKLLQSVSADSFASAFRTLKRSSALGDVQSIVTGPIGDALMKDKLWPLPFLSIQSTAIKPTTDGWNDLTLTVDAFVRMN